MKPKHRVIAASLIVIAAILLLFVLLRDRILWSLGAMLTSTESPQKAEVIVVLGGGSRGERILKAADLARKGYAPKVFVSGGAGVYGHFESDLATDYAVDHGYPRGEFISFHYPALSTVDEANADIQELRRRGIHKVLLVTSIYHSARASRIFRRFGSDLEIHSVPAPELYWQNGVWWKTREGRKIWFNETVRTIGDYLGL